ncbi:MAG: PKD-like family lipoprotein [Candidatus Pseudobacter hemicellulosilyticus]|uniref:PKD-like family lipoprotein n=1 Tax=Candidatus Pseudobacter hemicellulosilyticus TaxID=3121375 RepID=A0AAJ6BFT1_9BACT|nr:MAG: PKD-like family lipoprotein [Pseudobacter sp.]
MNIKYIFLIALLPVLAVSCYKDKSNTSELILPEVSVTGFQPGYTVFTHQDMLDIAPAVENESLFDFYWTLYSTNFNVQEGVVPRADTIARTRALHYEVLLNPGAYILIFNVRNKTTGVTELLTSKLQVSTLTMSGWYFLKDDGANTDFDFVYPDGRIDNWIAFFNGGRNLPGKAVKAVYAPAFKSTPTSSDLYNAFVVLSEQDAVICRIDNGEIKFDFDNMFFTKPAVRKLQNVVQPMINNIVTIINDNKPYTLTKGGLFANFPPSSYRLAPQLGVAGLVMGFDQQSKTVINLDNANYTALGASGDALKNMNAELVWSIGYSGLRSMAALLFRHPSGNGSFYKLNATYGHMAGWTTPLIADVKTVPAGHGLLAASIIAGNYDADYYYYAQGNKLYLTDLASLTENLQLELPAGEEITCVQHVKYPQPAANVLYTTDYLAIASYSAGHYKIWLHRISSTGTVQPLAQPNYEGSGRVSCINYLENGIGARIF